MDAARNASEKPEDFHGIVVQLLMNIDRRLGEIHETMRAPKKELDDEDICDMAVHYLIQCGPNLSEIVRKMEAQGVRIRRQSLAEAKKFTRFREKLEVFRPRSGFKKDDGTIEACE